MKNLKPIAALVLIVLLGGEWLLRQSNQSAQWDIESTSSGTPLVEGSENPELLRAYHQQLSNVWLTGSGKVTKLLADDNKGSRHQRFLIKVNASQTLLIAHNIDLAKRIDQLQVGDTIDFHGEYEWNKKGGVLHWTHHDPSGKKDGGWIKHENQLYK